MGRVSQKNTITANELYLMHADVRTYVGAKFLAKKRVEQILKRKGLNKLNAEGKRLVGRLKEIRQIRVEKKTARKKQVAVALKWKAFHDKASLISIITTGLIGLIGPQVPLLGTLTFLERTAIPTGILRANWI